MFYKIATGTAALLMAGSAFAGGAIDFGLSNTSVRIEHDAAMVGTGAHFTVGGVYNETNQSSAILAGFNAVDATMANKEMIGGIGFKAMGLSNTVADFAVGLGVGGFVRWQPDFMNGLGFEGQAYFSPSILSFGDLTSANELVARVTYKVLPQARVFLGYHDLRGEYDISGEAETGLVDSTVHLGFRMTY
ncbi:YfaZ family outer membrane protein [Reinekea marina]|uniref:YfaZ family outer membrane protein n=2 Tax=Reinekea marina TaxID=1310421 RepID=A0ABV7WMD4_9GAMM|nr:YfaZ family protein [Reinekea forsetii]